MMMRSPLPASPISESQSLTPPWKALPLSNVYHHTSLFRVGLVFLVLTILFPAIRLQAQGRGNIRPVITGQRPLSTNAGQPITITLEDLIVIDLNDPYPDGFSLTVFKQGNRYEVQGNTVIPRPDFDGTLKVPVTVSDGKDESRKFQLSIVVFKSDDDDDDDDDNDGDDDDGDDDDDDDDDDDNNNGGNNPGTANTPPVITGQATLQTRQNTALQLTLQQLTVDDPDNLYPGDFTLNVLSGQNYTVSGNTIIPREGFTGTLSVDVTVNDGFNDSPRFSLSISVLPLNVAPVITGQKAVSTKENTAVQITLDMLEVTDPDNDFPEDFTLTLIAGANYSIDGLNVVPANNFSGALDVGVRVNDGAANSNVYPLRVTVNAVNDPPRITGQAALTTKEDTPLTLRPEHLSVSDPDDQYPAGFSIRIVNGANYTAEGLTITPARNFYGTLSVQVIVNDGELDSDPYLLAVVVTPVNDAPVIANMEEIPIGFLAGSGPVVLTEDAEVSDPDGDNIVLAEITFGPETYRRDYDVLVFDRAQLSASSIEGVFDTERGALIFIGMATAEDYQKVLRSVRFDFMDEDRDPVNDTLKTVHFVVSDGTTRSEPVTRNIDLTSTIDLDIPRAFTPNGDMANDTWKVTPLQAFGDYENAITRVYNIRGHLLYEATGFEWEWDGTYNGEFLPTDTYYYTISLNLTLRPARYKGIVTILR